VPGRVFTETKRTRLGAFPSEISELDLIRYYNLSGVRARVREAATGRS